MDTGDTEAQAQPAGADIDEYVRQVVATFPPLTAAQKEHLAPLLRAGVIAVQTQGPLMGGP